jgi:hypothetical protein
MALLFYRATGILYGHEARAPEAPHEWPSRTGTKPGRQDTAPPRPLLQSVDQYESCAGQGRAHPRPPATHIPQVFPKAA